MNYIAPSVAAPTLEREIAKPTLVVVRRRRARRRRVASKSNNNADVEAAAGNKVAKSGTSPAEGDRELYRGGRRLTLYRTASPLAARGTRRRGTDGRDGAAPMTQYSLQCSRTVGQ
eukprot:1193240-Prorocentrum_minimum.AAC.4